MSRKKKRVLLTGSAGAIGNMFREFARHLYDFVCFDRRKTEEARHVVIGELDDLDRLTRAAKGCDAFVHLAACPRPADFHEVMVPSNIVGAYHAYEAAVRARVKRFVFASSVQVDNGYGEDIKVTSGMRQRPDNFYGASKVFGENLGRIYSRRHGLSVICLRFGGVATLDDAEWMLQYGMLPGELVTLPTDACQIIRHSIEARGVRFAALPAFSRNAFRLRDLTQLKNTIGYAPREDCYELWGVAPPPKR